MNGLSNSISIKSDGHKLPDQTRGKGPLSMDVVVVVCLMMLGILASAVYSVWGVVR